MKMGSKRGQSAAVLETPEENDASETAYERPSSRCVSWPAEEADDPRAEALERPAFARRRVAAKPSRAVRLHLPIIPRTLAGRIFAVVCLLTGLGASVAVALVGRQYLLQSPRFRLAGGDAIEVLGNHQLTRAQALGVFAADQGRSIFHVSLAERRADLERLPWVEHATVMRLLPNRLRVVVVERTPVAFVRQGTQIGLVDASGVLLDMPADAAGNPQYSFPVLTGIEAGDPLSTRRARMQIYRNFMKALADGGEQVLDSLSEVDVTDPEDVKAVVAREGSDVLVHFGDQQFLERYRVFDEHLAEWKQAYPKLVSADLRYNNQIVLDSGVAQPPEAAAGAASGTGASAAEVSPAPAPAKPAAKAQRSGVHPVAAHPARKPGAAAHPPARPAAVRRPAAGGPAQ